MTTVRLHGMAVETQGDGPALLMLHGLGGTSNAWEPLVPFLDGFRLVRPDLPGAGRSGDPRRILTVPVLAEAVLALLAPLGFGRVHLAGHSFGTLIAQHVAAAAPERVASLALFGPLIAPGEAARERLRARAARARAEGMDGIAEELSRGSVHRDAHPACAAFVRESHMRQDAEGFALSCEALAGAEAADHRRITAPALIVTGEDDAVAPPTAARQLAERIAGARAEVLARCGHWTQVEKPKECGERLAAFLAAAGRG